MFSYRFMSMSMRDSRDGTSRISPEETVTTQANPFANPPSSPPTLRVVPTDMTMDMHMLGIMYAPSDRVTLMGMTSYQEREMDHITFAGPVGTTRCFTTKTSGIGDTTLSALIGIGDVAHSANHARLHATLGVSLPTGDIEADDRVLTPMNTSPSLRLPYPMQLGSGTYDLIAGLTYADEGDRWGWGSQWRSVIRLGENDEDYTLGDEHKLQGWVSYLVGPSLSVSARAAYYDRGNIDGSDPLIRAPVQTADPDRQGIERLDLSVGANWLLPGAKHRLAVEFGVPVYQKLDGPQLQVDWMVTLGWQLVRH